MEGLGWTDITLDYGNPRGASLKSFSDFLDFSKIQSSLTEYF